LYILAGECRDQQRKDSKNEIKEASNLFLKYSKDKNSKNIQGALLCASKCLLNFYMVFLLIPIFGICLIL